MIFVFFKVILELEDGDNDDDVEPMVLVTIAVWIMWIGLWLGEIGGSDDDDVRWVCKAFFLSFLPYSNENEEEEEEEEEVEDTGENQKRPAHYWKKAKTRYS